MSLHRFARTRFILALLMVASVAAPARAQLRDRSPVFVVDVTDARNRVAIVSAATFNEALHEAPPPGEVWGTPIERAFNACSPRPERVMTPAERDASNKVIEKLQGCVDCLRAHQEKRFMTSANDEVALFVLFKPPLTADQIRPFFHEVPRESELVATAKAIAGLVREAGVECRAFTYTLQRKRSRFKIVLPKVGTPEDATASAAPAARPDALIETEPAAAKQERLDIETPEVILGPPEHWFFSADFSMSATEFELTKTPEADQDKVKSKDFFVALNFALGDLLVDRDVPIQRRSFLKELLIKVQVSPSKEPWTAWAVGVGLRGYRIKTILWNMDVAHPYFTFGRQSIDVTDTATGATTTDRRWRAVFGLGFDPRSLKK